MRMTGMLLALALAACSTGQPVTRQVVVSGAQFEGVRGEADLVVRTWLAGAEERSEVLGAECDVRSSLYAARLVTPSRLVLPNFGPQSPELEITCRAADLSGSARAAIATYWRYPPGYYPPVGPYPYGFPGYGWGGWGWPAPAYPVSEYRDVGVELRRE